MRKKHRPNYYDPFLVFAGADKDDTGMPEYERQACRGYEICHPYPYPYPQIFRGYPWIYPWISMNISISTDAYRA